MSLSRLVFEIKVTVLGSVATANEVRFSAKGLLAFLLLLVLTIPPAQADFAATDQAPSEVSPLAFTLAKGSSVAWASVSDGICSGVFISNSGYMLTALHCLKHCLLAHPRFLKPIKDAHAPSGGIYEVDQAHLQMQTPALSCDAVLLGQDRNTNDLKPEQMVQARVLATGRGFLTDDALSAVQREINNFSFLERNGFGAADDFAVLKFSVSPPTPCARLATMPLKVGADIWTIAYPKASHRPSGVNSDGIRAWLSTGRVNHSGLENQCLRPELAGLSEQDLNELRFEIDPPGISWTTLDGELGSSGAPVFNRDGEVAGVFVAGYSGKSDPERVYCSGGTEMIHVDTVVSQLSKVLSKSDFDNITRCQIVP